MPSSNKMVEVEDLWLRYDTRTVLEDINLTIHQNEFVVITGPNGGGKTSLLRVVLGLQHPERGSVHYFREGNPVSKLNIGYLPQKNMIDSRFPLTVYDVVSSGLMCEGFGFRRRLSAEQQERMQEILSLIGMEEFSASSIGNLSGGQLQRTLLGRAIISNPELLVLDEPASYVDKRFEERLYDLLSRLASKTTILLVSHELTPLTSMATRTLYVNRVLR